MSVLSIFRKKEKAKRAKAKLTIDAKIGLGIVIVFVFLAIAGPTIAPNSPSDILVMNQFEGPGEAGPLGSDYLGRDLFSRLLYGARLTLGLAFMSTLLGFIIGVLLGFVAAEIGGWIDNLVTAVIDILISFPPILLALVVIVSLGSSLPVLVLTVALIHASRVARIARSLAMDVGANDFMEVARVRGEGLWYMLRYELLQNTTRTLAAEFGLRMTFSILFLSALSFLGLGIQPPAADWGVMVKENISGLLYGSPAPLIPAAAIGVITVGINLLVDWLIRGTGQGISKEML
jgi:peptide/nickel transport system permease protein